MASPAILKTVLFLRVFSLLALAASVVLMGLNNFTDFDGFKIRFFDLIAYRYVFAAGAIGFLYTLIQIPFALYNVVTEKRWIRNGFLQQFDFYGDKTMAFLLASGVGVGFGVSFEFKRLSGDDLSSKSKKFLDMGNISTGLLLVGFVSMALLSIISSNRRSSSSPIKGFFK
ncbi:CASP-like protein 4D1 [Sesamum alatum]|uniref:CASP-like protein n=1 Tax=Sesamum alatum TaxID=300844 RepID=A0AAE2CWM5_9LAMI|nr:CASP-like protein 4D1 [Sesamum alatum]